MPSTEREDSRDRELVLKHQPSFSDSGRASVPMYAHSARVNTTLLQLNGPLLIGLHSLFFRSDKLIRNTTGGTAQTQIALHPHCLSTQARRVRQQSQTLPRILPLQQRRYQLRLEKAHTQSILHRKSRPRSHWSRVTSASNPSQMAVCATETVIPTH